MANQKISEYLNTRNTFDDGDLFDVSAFLNPGYESQKTTYAIFKANLVSAGFLSSGDNVSELTNDAGYVTSNITHTGEVTGLATLSLDSTAITNKTTVTAVSGDFVLISDTSDAGNLKKVDAADFLAGGADGNGIYDGSGSVPTTTIATLTDSLTFVGALGQNLKYSTGGVLEMETTNGSQKIRVSTNANVPNGAIEIRDYASFGYTLGSIIGRIGSASIPSTIDAVGFELQADDLLGGSRQGMLSLYENGVLTSQIKANTFGFNITQGNLGIGTAPTNSNALKVGGNAQIDGSVLFNDYIVNSALLASETTDYALFQNGAGQTVVNAKAGEFISLRLGNTNRQQHITSSGTFFGNTSSTAVEQVEIDGNLDVENVYFSQNLVNSALKASVSTDYALLQNTAGQTVVNAKAGEFVQLRVGNTIHLQVKSSGVINMANLPTSSAGLVAGDLWNNSGVINIV